MGKNLRTSIEKIPAAPGQRILVVSDIHGHVNRLVQLLKKLEYGESDILVIVGDLIDKGPESLRVVRYVMELCRQRPVYVSMGNVDLGRLRQIWDDTQESDGDFAGFLRWSQKAWGSCLALEMLKELGIDVSQVDGGNAGEIKKRLREAFREELDFLWSRPTVLTAGDYLFVHGGVPTDDLEALAKEEPFSLLKNDDFLNKGFCFERYTVVTGHWPTCLYRRDQEDVSPLIERKRRIVCIDGGCGLKSSGQLNGLILPDCRAGLDRVRWTSYDDFPVARALENQEPTPSAIHIQYFDSRVELLEERDGLARVRHLSSGGILTVPKSWTYHGGHGNLHCSDWCDGKLSVAAGEELSVIFEADGSFYAKKEGRIGYYDGPVEWVTAQEA
ncbi:MAG: metallophosphoesterase [bacterium]|nr:metallophosphoesterase [bacterium]